MEHIKKIVCKQNDDIHLDIAKTLASHTQCIVFCGVEVFLFVLICFGLAKHDTLGTERVAPFHITYTWH
jgi:hypothetical protein